MIVFILQRTYFNRFRVPPLSFYTSLTLNQFVLVVYDCGFTLPLKRIGEPDIQKYTRERECIKLY